MHVAAKTTNRHTHTRDNHSNDNNNYCKLFEALKLIRVINPRRACAARVTVVVSCVCVCVCVWGANDQKEFGINVRKEKVKRLRGVCQHQ